MPHLHLTVPNTATCYFAYEYYQPCLLHIEADSRTPAHSNVVTTLHTTGVCHKVWGKLGTVKLLNTIMPITTAVPQIMWITI